MNLLERLRKKDRFTSAESCLSDYILNNLEDVCLMSLQGLAKASYVSKPSVIRLYRKLGYEKYRDFSIALQLEKIREDQKDPIEMNTDFVRAGTLYDFAEKIGTISRNVIENCVRAVDGMVLEQIVDSLLKAERIFLYPVGKLESQMSYFMERMALIDLQPRLLTAGDPVMTSLNKEDVVLIVSVSHSSDEGVSDEVLRSEALRILLTCADVSLSRYQPDLCLYEYPDGNDFIRSNNLVSQMSVLFGLNLIQLCLWKRKLENE